MARATAAHRATGGSAAGGGAWRRRSPSHASVCRLTSSRRTASRESKYRSTFEGARPARLARPFRVISAGGISASMDCAVSTIVDARVARCSAVRALWKVATAEGYAQENGIPLRDGTPSNMPPVLTTFRHVVARVVMATRSSNLVDATTRKV